MAKRLWAGLDVGVETTKVCVIDEAGEVLHEAVCATNVKSVHKELVFLKRRNSAGSQGPDDGPAHTAASSG